MVLGKAEHVLQQLRWHDVVFVQENVYLVELRKWKLNEEKDQEKWWNHQLMLMQGKDNNGIRFVFQLPDLFDAAFSVQQNVKKKKRSWPTVFRK